MPASPKCARNALDASGASTGVQCSPTKVNESVSLEFGVRGPVWNLSTACSSSNHAMGQAYWLVRDGISDVALIGGHEAFFTYGNLKAWDALRVVAPDTCRPFAKDRLGMVLGDGGAMLVVETLEHARARGFGGTSSASPLTCGVATLVATREPALRGQPEAVKAILMASALRDIG